MTAAMHTLAPNVFAPGLALRPIRSIEPSPTNPRRRIDPAKLDELTASIRAVGVLQPILVRPHPQRIGFEIVVGERRWRAAQAAGLDQIPAIATELDDATVLELQITENLQRADVHPLEEADGYQRLMTVHHYTADQVAEKIGKSRRYVFNTLKLLDLSPDAREALYDGLIDRSKALLIARLPSTALQNEVVENLRGGGHYARLPVRQFAQEIENRYMLRLDAAPFALDDGALVPAAGPCTTCPKRTGNQAELFGEASRTDLCTDGNCYRHKEAALWAGRRATWIEQGLRVFEGDEAIELCGGTKRLWNLDAEWLNLDQNDYDYDDERAYFKPEDLVGQDGNLPTWRELVEQAVGTVPYLAMLEDPSEPGTFVAIAPRAAVTEALSIRRRVCEHAWAQERKAREAEPRSAETERSGSATRNARDQVEDAITEREQARRAAQARRNQAAVLRERAARVARSVARAPTFAPTLGDLRLIARAVVWLDELGDGSAVAAFEHMGLGSDGFGEDSDRPAELRAWVANAAPDLLARLLVAWAIECIGDSPDMDINLEEANRLLTDAALDHAVPTDAAQEEPSDE